MLKTVNYMYVDEPSLSTCLSFA